MSTLKKFDLQAALAGAPVITRDGRKVIRIAHFPEAPDPDGRVLFLPEHEYSVEFCNEEGEWVANATSDLDLFMATKTKTMYAIIMKEKDGRPFALDLQETRPSCEHETIATITWEESE